MRLSNSVADGLQCGHSPKAVENQAWFRPVEAKHRFNAATARRPWRTWRARIQAAKHELQCGHSPKAVENKLGPVECCPAAGASMRPQPEGRGERQATSEAGELEASMRPQPEGRGEHSTGPLETCRRMLQCGHSPKAVENAFSQLRGLSKCRRFNAATARRLWRTKSTAAIQRHCDWPASMRPQPEGRGELHL